MNVFLAELRMLRKSTIIWSVVMALFMYVSMVKYGTIAKDAVASQQLIDAFPDTMKAVFGMTGLDLTTVSGYVGVCFIFVAILLALHGGLLGAQLIAREETDHTSEFLYVRPRSRAAILLAKLCTGVTVLSIVWSATVLGSYGSIASYASMKGFYPDFWLLMAAALIIHWTCFALGFAAAALTRNGERLVAYAVTLSYALYVFANLLPTLDIVHYLSIFSYFDAADILAAHALKLHYVIVCIIVSAVSLGIAFAAYHRRDLRI